MKEKFRQFQLAWRQLREVDELFVRIVLLAALAGLLLGAGLGYLIAIWASVLFGVLLAMLGGLIAFSRRVQKAQYTAVEGQPGAAAAILDIMRGQWFVSPAIAVNAKRDMVHRVVGRCGVVLVGEGSPQRVRSLIAKERKRLNRVVGDAPINSMVVGDGEGEVPLNRLQVTLTKLPRELKRDEVPRLERRLKSLDKAPPIPKGIDPMAAGNRRRPKPR